MNDDFMFVFGILAILASLPGLLNSFSSGTRPGVWAVLIIAGFGLLTVALVQNPTAYSFDSAPDAFKRVFSRLF